MIIRNDEMSGRWNSAMKRGTSWHATAASIAIATALNGSVVLGFAQLSVLASGSHVRAAQHAAASAPARPKRWAFVSEAARSQLVLPQSAGRGASIRQMPVLALTLPVLGTPGAIHSSDARYGAGSTMIDPVTLPLLHRQFMAAAAIQNSGAQDERPKPEWQPLLAPAPLPHAPADDETIAASERPDDGETSLGIDAPADPVVHAMVAPAEIVAALPSPPPAVLPLPNDRSRKQAARTGKGAASTDTGAETGGAAAIKARTKETQARRAASGEQDGGEEDQQAAGKASKALPKPMAAGASDRPARTVQSLGKSNGSDASDWIPFGRLDRGP